MTVTARRTVADCLLRPASIAIVGASENTAKTNSRPQRFLSKHGYRGVIHPVNPARERLFDRPCHPSVSAIGAPVDHAHVMVPTRAVEAVLDDCIAAGVPCVSIFSDGFAERGPEGMAAQARLVEKARSAGVRLLGPNSLGVVNTHLPMMLTANAVFARDTVPAGRIGLVSQSGSLIGALVSRGQARGIGFSTLVSVGNEADLSVGEIAEMLVDDPETDVIVLFLETLRARDSLVAMAERAHAAGKPVMVYMLGRSEVGQTLARSHTGALGGQAAAMEAFLADLGVVRVNLFDSLLETPALLAGRRPPGGRRVAVVATTGGGGALVADHLGERGVDVASPPEALRAAFAGHGLTLGESRIIDLTMAGTREAVVDDCLGTLMAAPDIDAVAMVIGSSAEFYPDLAVKPLAKWARSSKPIAAFLFPNAEASLALLAEAGLAAFRTPEACADALAAYLAWTPPRRRPEAAIPEAAAALLRAGDQVALNEHEALALFADLGIPVAETRVVAPGEALPEDLGYPLAVKILSRDIVHKSDAGGVMLGVPDREALAAAIAQIEARVAASHPQARREGVVLQRMQRGLGEAIVGIRHDPVAGFVVMVGAGGLLAEVYRDVAIRMAPVTRDEALAMIAEIRGFAPLRGARGHPPGDLDALADAVAALSRLALTADAAVAEAEINPMVVGPAGEGVVAVDGVVLFGDGQGG